MCLCITSASWLNKFFLVDVDVTFLFDWHLVHCSHNCMLLVWLFPISFRIHFPCFRKSQSLNALSLGFMLPRMLSIYFCLMMSMFLLITMSASPLDDAFLCCSTFIRTFPSSSSSFVFVLLYGHVLAPFQAFVHL